MAHNDLEHPDHGKRRRKWKRSQKIALGVVILGAVIPAVITYLIIPSVSYGYKYITQPTQPQAYISFPAQQAILTDNDISASGTASNIPVGDELWLVIQAGSVGKWYPVQQLDAQNGSWRIGKGIICPASGPLTLEVYLVPDSGGEAFFQYISPANQNKAAGIDQTPPMAVPLGYRSVNVPANYLQGCNNKKGNHYRRLR